MENVTGYLDSLAHLSPVDEPDIPLGTRGPRRGPWMTTRGVMIVAGVGLVLTCGLVLFFVYGIATMLPDDEPGYWSLVFEMMFGLKYGGSVAIPSSLGILLGTSLILFGILRHNSFGRSR
jgi:hypothetical protein